MMTTTLASDRLWNSARRGGFTRTDFIVVVSGLVLLAVIMTAGLTGSRNKVRLKICSANLHQVSRAVLLYAEDHAGTLPSPQNDPGDFWWWYKERVKQY